MIAALLGMALGACSNKPAPDELARAVSMGERPVAMEGYATFFNNTLGVTATVSRGIGTGKEAAQGAGGGKGGKRAERGQMPDISGMDAEEATAYMRARAAVGSPMPLVTLHLKLKNLSSTTFSVEIDDFNSDLGNFAVRPAILSLAPDQLAEPDPMISQLGVTSDDLSMVVTLKKLGRKETQIVHVRSLSPASGASPANLPPPSGPPTAPMTAPAPSGTP